MPAAVGDGEGLPAAQADGQGPVRRVVDDGHLGLPEVGDGDEADGVRGAHAPDPMAPAGPPSTLGAVALDLHDAVQQLVDDLAARLGQPVDLEDRDLRVLAYSAHDREVDSVRSRSILGRGGPKDVEEWMRRHGIHAAVAPLRLPAAPEIGMVPRVCVPVRDPAGLLGFLWLVDDPPGSVGEDDLAATAAAAGRAAVLLRELRAGEDAARAARDRLVHDALAGDADAAAGLVADGLLPAGIPLTVVVGTAVDGAGGPARRLLPSGHALDVRSPADELVLLAAVPAGTDPATLAARLAELTGGAVGLGGPHPAEDLPQALAQARAARLVAARVPGTGAAVRFADLGVDGTLALLPPAAREALARVPALARLAAGDGDGALRTTLLAWLDHGGEATAAAADLSLHRATLYHRLKRIETLAEVRLDDGDTRLALHLALRAERLLEP